MGLDSVLGDVGGALNDVLGSLKSGDDLKSALATALVEALSAVPALAPFVTVGTATFEIVKAVIAAAEAKAAASATAAAPAAPAATPATDNGDGSAG